MNTKVFAILIAAFCVKSHAASISSEEKHCYAEETHPYLHFGTKTAYETMHGTIKNTTVGNCKPVQIWMLVRHGTRNPSASQIRDMKHQLPQLRDSIVKNEEKYGNGSLCKEDIERLKWWKIDPMLQESKKDFLREQGKRDLKLLGKRYKSYYPELVQMYPRRVMKKKYKFRSTDTERTVKSMNYFIKGAFPTKCSVIDTEVVPLEKDTLLKPYDTCKPWLEGKDESEVQKFLQRPLFGEIIANVSRRLGLGGTLSFDEVYLMYMACFFETAWHITKQRSPWCAAFVEDELKVFEYEADLHYYYYSSYGRKINPSVGCPPLKDMFEHFTKLESGDASGEPQGIFYFSHSTMVQLLLTSMGVAKDSTPLTASNFEEMGDRKWSTSHLIPFASNLAAIFYKCDSSNKVRLFLNEKPLEYEGCEMGVCDWEHLKQKLGPTAFNCNIDFCYE